MHHILQVDPFECYYPCHKYQWMDSACPVQLDSQVYQPVLVGWPCHPPLFHLAATCTFQYMLENMRSSTCPYQWSYFRHHWAWDVDQNLHFVYSIPMQYISWNIEVHTQLVLVAVPLEYHSNQSGILHYNRSWWRRSFARFAMLHYSSGPPQSGNYLYFHHIFYSWHRNHPDIEHWSMDYPQMSYTLTSKQPHNCHSYRHEQIH